MFYFCSQMAADPTLAETVAAEHRVMLRELAQIGMELARALPEQARSEGADGQALALAFSRVSRAIRLTLALEARTLEPAEAVGAPWERDEVTEAQRSEQNRTDSRREETYDLIE